MKAIAYTRILPIDHPEALFECELATLEPGPHDLLVEIKAVSVNPVDCKIRNNVAPEAGQLKVLGWDAAGIVIKVGAEVSLFKPGDRVFYAGELTRQGSNAELQLVDERIVGVMPKSLSFAEAAALPLTSITAWELLFDRLQIKPLAEVTEHSTKQSVFISGAAGGVGSIAIQLLKQLTDAIIIGTASRSASSAWVKQMGAAYVFNHQQPLAPQLTSAGLGQVSHVASLTHTDQNYLALLEILQPQGRFGLIDDPQTLDIKAFKRKSISLHWEFMYTRSLFQTPDLLAQHHLLNRISALVDAGQIRSTLTEHLGTISAANLKRAHQLIAQQQVIGKIVLEGF